MKPYAYLPAPRVNVLYSVCYSDCQGKDAANYTLWGEWTEDLVADTTQTADWNNQLIQSGPNHQRAVVSLKILAKSLLPAGGTTGLLLNKEPIWEAWRLDTLYYFLMIPFRRCRGRVRFLCGI